MTDNSRYIKRARENLVKKGYRRESSASAASPEKKSFRSSLPKVDEKYLRDFARDADSVLKQGLYDSGSAGYSDIKEKRNEYRARAAEVDEKAKTIRAYARIYGEKLGEEMQKKYLDVADLWSRKNKEYLKEFQSRSSIMASFKSEDDYNKAVDDAKLRQKYGDMSYDQQKKALNDLQVRMAEEGISEGDNEELDREVDYLREYGVRGNFSSSAEYDEAIRDLINRKAEIENHYISGETFTGAEQSRDYTIIEDLNKRIESLEAARNEVKTAEEIRTEYGKYTEADDFAEGSKYVSTAKNLSDEEIKALGYKKTPAGEWAISDLGGYQQYDPYGDPIYEYINADDNTQNQMFNEEQLLNRYNGIDTGVWHEDRTKNSKYKTYGEMTDEEVSIYNYLYATDKASAQKYLDALSPALDKRFNQKEYERLADIGYESPGASSVISIGTNVRAGLDSILKVTADLMGGDGSAFDSSSRLTSALRGGAGEKWGDVLDVNIPVIDQNLGEFLYGVVMSGADMATALALGKGVGGAGAAKATQFIMSSEAASSAIYEAHENGITGNEAALRGIAAGMAEWVTEKYSIENLLGGEGRNILINALKQGGIEATEEGASSLLNTAADKLLSEVYDHQNEVEAEIDSLIKNGMSRNEAEQKVLAESWKGIASDALAGFFSGAPMGTGSAVINNYKYKHSPEKLALDIDIAETARGVEGHLSGLGEGGDLATLSSAIAKEAKGEALTRAEKKALKERDDSSDLVEAVKSGEIAPVELTTEELLKILNVPSDGETEADAAETSDETEAAIGEKVTNVGDGRASIAPGQRVTVSKDGDSYTFSHTDADGTEVTLKSTELDSDSLEARVSEMATRQKMSPATVQTVINEYDGRSDVFDYVEEAEYVYSMGKTGVPLREVSTGGGRLTNAAREMLYDDGVMYTEGVNRARDKAYRALTERTEGSVTAGRFDATSLKGMKLNATQKRNMRFAEGLSKLGFNIRLVSEVKGNKRALGFYNEKTGDIEVNVNGSLKDLRSTVRGQFLSTLSHELTHRMKNTAGGLYTEYRDVVLRGFEEAGELDSMVTREMARLRNTGRYKNMSDGALLEVATDEIIARASENMLKDSDAIERLIAKNRTLGEKILEFIGDVAERLKSILKEFEGEESLREEAQLLREMVDTYEEAKAKWSAAFARSAENVSAANAAGVVGDQIVMTEDGEVVYEATSDGSIRFNEATYDEEGRDKLRVFLEKQVKNKQLSNEDAVDILTSLEDIYDTIHEFRDKFAPYGEWADAKVVRDGKGNPVFSVVTPNGEYAMNIDFSLVCKKRRMLDAVFNRMIKRGVVDDFALGKEEIVKINDIIKSHGFEIACALCFVDAKRFRQAGVADSFVEIYNGIVNEITPEGVDVPYFNFGGNSKLSTEGDGLKNVKVDNSVFDRYVKEYGAKSVPGRVAKYLKTHPADRKLLSRGDFISTAGFDAVRTQKPDILKLFNAKKGSGGPKSAFSDTQYLNEIIERSAFNAAKAFLVGGVRVQSFSDYIPRLVFDYCQMIADLSAKKLPAHAYSKESLFVKQFGKTGVKINMSLIPKMADGGVAAGLDADGNYAWADESFDFETAKAIQDADGYTDNCGTICVGVSTEHILKLLADPDIRMVIPYHKSGLNPIVAKMNKIEGFTDYTNFQNTRYKNADGTTGSKLTKADLKTQPNVNDLMQKGMDAKEAAQAYLDWCDEKGYVPKFDEFRDDPNYYKLLIDFVAYNKDGAAVPQGAVKMNFPKDGDAFGSMADLIEEGLEADAVTQFAQDEALDPIVDEIEQVLGDGDVLYSEYDDTSMREVLSGALLETAQSDAERSAVEKYQSKAREYDSMQRELEGINREIKQLSFGKGKRNTERMSELRGQKAVLEKKLQRADKKLLELEATKVLKDVLLRREGQLRRRQADALKKAKADMREKSTKELRATIEEGREMARRAKMGERMAAEAEIAQIKRRAAQREIERRERKAREESKRRAKDLISYITGQTDKKNVKEGIKGAATAFMKAILRDSGMFTPSEMGRLRAAYAKLEKNTPKGELVYAGAYDFDIMKDIEKLSEALSGKAWRDLTLEELEMVDRVTANLRTMIRRENRIFRDNRSEERLTLAEAEISDIDTAEKRRGGTSSLKKLLGTDNMTPVYFFKSLGGTMRKLFRDVEKAQDKAAASYDRARIKLEAIKKKHNYNSWKNNEMKEFTTEGGESFELSVGQAMYIYAALKRESADGATTNHLRGGGIVAERVATEIQKKKGTAKDFEERGIRLSEADLSEITSSLTDEQKAMADELVAYLSDDMAALGNEVSMKLFGIRKFTEGYYIPFSVASNYIHKDSISGDVGEKGASPEKKLKHTGMTNALQDDSAEPLVAADILDIWTEHVVVMANYNAFVLPIEAFETVLNFKDESGKPIREMFREKYGDNALAYLNKFMRDLNGGAVSIEKTGMEKFISLQKKNAVAANASVVIQQPTALLRAMAVIDPKYLATIRGGESRKPQSLQKIWNEMKRYAPGVTITKEMGKFDVGSGASAKEYIHSNGAVFGIKEKAERGLEKVDDILGLPAEWGDRIAWIQIWRACKAEVADKRGLTGDALLEAAGERFTEVINLTQVYDSVLSRSGHMRSKNPIAVMATAFKAEPTLTLNLLADAIRSKNGKVIARTTSVFLVQTIVNAALVSLVYAGRDDDEEKTYWEKYLSELTTKVMEDVMILGSVPYLSDVVSMLKGYDVNRMDMEVFKSITDAFNGVMKEDAGVAEWAALGGSVSNFLGIPLKNIARDMMIIPNIARSAKGTTAEGISYAISDELSGSMTDKVLRKVFGLSLSPMNYTGYISSLESGDREAARKIYGKIVEYKVFKAQRKAEAEGKNFDRNEAENTARSAVQSKLTSTFKDAYIAAYESGDLTEMERIKDILRRSEVYKKSISDVCRGWVKNADEDK